MLQTASLSSEEQLQETLAGGYCERFGCEIDG